MKHQTIAIPNRRCPRGGAVALEARNDQPGWFVACDTCGTLAKQLAHTAARACAEDHLAGGADCGQGLHEASDQRPGATT